MREIRARWRIKQQILKRAEPLVLRLEPTLELWLEVYVLFLHHQDHKKQPYLLQLVKEPESNHQILFQGLHKQLVVFRYRQVLRLKGLVVQAEVLDY